MSQPEIKRPDDNREEEEREEEEGTLTPEKISVLVRSGTLDADDAAIKLQETEAKQTRGKKD